MAALRDLYVETLVGAADFTDRIAIETIGRSPAHVILLHETDLAAMFVDDLLNEYADLFPGGPWHLGGDEYRDALMEIIEAKLEGHEYVAPAEPAAAVDQMGIPLAEQIVRAFERGMEGVMGPDVETYAPLVRAAFAFSHNSRVTMAGTRSDAPM